MPIYRNPTHSIKFSPFLFSFLNIFNRFIFLFFIFSWMAICQSKAQGRHFSKLRFSKYESDKVDSVFTTIINKKYPDLLINTATKFLTRPIDEYGFYPKLVNGNYLKEKVYECTVYLLPNEILIDKRFATYHIYNFNTGYFTIEEVINFAENPKVIAVDATLGKFEYVDTRYSKD